MKRSTPLPIIVLAIAATLPGCRRADLSGPPDLRLGRDQCAECGMIISEERSAAALLVERGGMREHLVFDDIGCMLDHEPGLAADTRVVDSFVRDYAADRWLRAADAVFVLAEREKLKTPMGSGIAAFGDRAAATTAAARFAGSVLDLAGVTDARRAQQKERHSHSSGQ